MSGKAKDNKNAIKKRIVFTAEKISKSWHRCFPRAACGRQSAPALGRRFLRFSVSLQIKTAWLRSEKHCHFHISLRFISFVMIKFFHINLQFILFLFQVRSFYSCSNIFQNVVATGQGVQNENVIKAVFDDSVPEPKKVSKAMKAYMERAKAHGIIYILLSHIYLSFLYFPLQTASSSSNQTNSTLGSAIQQI